MSYKSYEYYKISGINLIKNIPLNWNIFKLKFLITSLESGKRKDFEDENYALSLGGEHINWDGSLNLTNKRFISRDFYNSLNNGKVEKNDILLVKDGATIGKTAFVENLNCKMAVNEHVFIIRNNILIIPKLLYYLISSNIGFSQIKLAETGSAQGGISQNIKDKVLFSFPKAINEQLSLVRYLDNKIGIINNLISKNNELISLLEEKKVALINKCVTKGLNPNVSMKDSGIEWIGEIPQNWNVRKFAQLINLITKGATPTSYGFNFEDEGVNFVKIESLSENGEINYSRLAHISLDCHNFLARSKLQNGDLLFSIAGAIGKVGLVDESILPANTNQALAIIRHNSKFLFLKFLFYVLNSNYISNYMSNFIVQTAQANLSMDSIKEFKLLVPPLNEQKEISDYLDKKLKN